MNIHGKLTVRLGLALILSASLTGCGKSGPEMAKVKGTVKFQGKPLTKGTVNFISTDPKRGNASANIGPDGSYSLQTLNPEDGAELGDYNVVVSDTDPNALNTPAPGEPVKTQASAIPAKYQDPATSGLSKKVERGSNTFDINIE